ncbi:EAL domain-containing protein, partial [Methylophaga sp.]|uniref:EAL domain-containing protein n=1 Tax=Methylophaga sp. TaxID=2024840 RepID=UPI003F695D5B
GFVISAMLDIDDFQTLNTVLGHDVCDNVLKSIAEQLEEVEFQQNFCTYRVSADRFVVFKVESDETQAFSQKQFLMDQLEVATKTVYENHSFSVSITTVGYISKLNKLKQTPLLEQLELSLETVRLNGLKGQLVRASELDYKVALQSAALRLELASGVKKANLTIALQPKVNHANQISSFEALLRWCDERYPDLHLGHYISAAEATGAIIQVGYFVIEQTCLFIKSLPKALRKPVYVNLSMRQLSAGNFIERTTDLCHLHEIDNHLIGMELTESMVADDIDLVRKELEQITAAGFKISIDDFGTGQANLRYLSKLPLSQLKIDKSFIDDITNNASKVPIVDSVYAIAKSMNLTVVAEGV